MFPRVKFVFCNSASLLLFCAISNDLSLLSMKTNSIDCFDINGGALVYKQRKTKKTISGKYLLEQLEDYYKDQPELAKEITKKVLDNRGELIKEEIMRKIDK